jgi:hypothetical protein
MCGASASSGARAFDDVAVVQEAIEEGRDDGRVARELASGDPVRRRGRVAGI